MKSMRIPASSHSSDMAVFSATRGSTSQIFKAMKHLNFRILFMAAVLAGSMAPVMSQVQRWEDIQQPSLADEAQIRLSGSVLATFDMADGSEGTLRKHNGWYSLRLGSLSKVIFFPAGTAVKIISVYKENDNDTLLIVGKTSDACTYSTEILSVRRDEVFKRDIGNCFQQPEIKPYGKGVALDYPQAGNTTIRYTYMEGQLLRTQFNSLSPPQAPTAKLPEWAQAKRLAFDAYKKGDYAQAAAQMEHAFKLAEKTPGATAPDWSERRMLALSYLKNGDHGKATEEAEKILAWSEKALKPDDPVLLNDITLLASLYSAQGFNEKAVSLSARAVAAIERTKSPEDPSLVEPLDALAMSLGYSLSSKDRVESTYLRALSILEKAYGPEDPRLIRTLGKLGQFHAVWYESDKAEQRLNRALAIAERAYGPERREVSEALGNLAQLYLAQGVYGKSEALMKRALAIDEKSLGLEAPSLSKRLSSLALLYQVQADYNKAEPLIKRALAITEKAYGPDSLFAAGYMERLATNYREQGKFPQAEDIYIRVASTFEKIKGHDSLERGMVLLNLAGLYARQKQYRKAEPLYLEALTLQEKFLGVDHPNVAINLIYLAEVYKFSGNFDKAEDLYQRALSIREKKLGPRHRDVAEALYKLAANNILAGKDVAAALELLRRSSAISLDRMIAVGGSDSTVREATAARAGFESHLRTLTAIKNPEQKLVDESFQIVQLARASSTAEVIAQMAARFARGNDELANLIKRKQDAAAQLAKNDELLVQAAGMAPDRRNSKYEAELREANERAQQQVKAADEDLAKRFPDYDQLVSPRPVAVAQVQSLLKRDEAMLVYDVRDSTEGGVSLWVVTQSAAKLLKTSADLKNLTDKVSDIQEDMSSDSIRRVDVAALHGLYKEIVAPAQLYLDGISHLIVVPSGALQSLPFSMLVATAPQQESCTTDCAQVDWLVKHYAISVLPSVGSIRALRLFSKPGLAPAPFAGFGDPDIGGAGDSKRGKSRRVDISRVFRGAGVQLPENSVTPLQRLAIADVDAIRNAPALPETADELRTMAKVLKAPGNPIWVRKAANETTVKRLDLSKYRTIAFATHGVMSGEVRGVGEPGLILTPPQKGTIEDDGYLSSSEIARLNLNADWVILSACNTASSDGTPGAEGLSGLAKAFFYAGARSLLVSYWPVNSEATVPLTTVMLREYESNPTQGKAEAQRKAMLALMTTKNRPEYSHPMFWAPFVVVGEGGVRR